ncbi:MAG: phage tail protein [Cyanobacteria bacterium P01_A01_bin.40]
MTGVLEAVAISAAASLFTAGVSYALSPTQKVEGDRLRDLTTAKSNYGESWVWAWGTVRNAENRLWSSFIDEKTKKTKRGKGTKVESKTYKYYGYWAMGFAECPFRPIVRINRLYFNKDLVYSAVGDSKTIAAGAKYRDKYLRFYYGSDNQPIDPLLQSKKSILNYSYGIPSDPDERDAYLRSFGIDPATQVLTPAYNKRLVVVVERAPLADFYNAVPKGECEYVASENCTVGQIYQDIFSLVYPDYSFNYDAISTPEFAVDGFQLNSVDAAKNAIQNLQKSHFIDIYRAGNEFRFVPFNSQRNVINLRSEDLAAHTSGKEKPLNYDISEVDAATLPSNVIVKYIDKDLDYDASSQPSTLQVKQATNDNTLTLTFTEVMSGSKAATIADRSLMFAWILANKYKFTLPPTYLNLEPTDLLPNLFDDKIYPIKLEQIRVGANLILECVGVLHDITPLFFERTLEAGSATVGVADYTVAINFTGNLNAVTDNQGNTYTEGVDYTNNNGSITVLESGSINQGTDLILNTSSVATLSDQDLGIIPEPSDTELFVLEIPLIQDDDLDYTLYLAAGGGDNWDGAAIYYSIDNSRYILATEFETYSVYGNCLTPLTSPLPGGTEGGTVTVQVNEPELESITDNDLALGFNLALIGNKICQFKTADLLDTNTYQLSNLITGLRGTETEPDPIVGDRFVLLTGENAEIQRIIGSATDIGEVRYFKAVTVGQIIDEVDPVVVTIQGNAQKPYAPVNLAATVDSLGNITVTWQRRDRHAALEINNPPLSEKTEDYRIQIVRPDDTIARTASSNISSYIYTADQQIADFGSVVSTITVAVAQVSDDVGIGSWSQSELTPNTAEPAPIITSFTPLSAQIGATINVVGDNLVGVTDLTINGISQTNLAVTDNQNISFVIAENTISGNLNVTTTGGSAVSNSALIIETAPPEQKSNFPLPNPVILPYLIVPADKETEIIADAQTGILTIPDDASAFNPGWGCYVSLDNFNPNNPLTVTIEKEDLAATGNKTDGIIGINTVTDNQTVKLWYRGDDVWKID